MRFAVLNGSVSMPLERLELPSVTLAAITSVAIDATCHAMTQSLKQVAFGKALFLSDCPPIRDLGEDVSWQRIPSIRSREDYSHFVLKRLAHYITTPYVLIIQWDGFILNGASWTQQFLEYDYIGAPWIHYPDNHTVGNGGFSLRSKRLLEACTSLPNLTGEAEDVLICRVFRERLERHHDIRFSPNDLAERFSFERTRRQGNEFGFHGVFNMMGIVPSDKFAQILTTLEPGLIRRTEHREILVEAFRRREWKIFWKVWRSHRSERQGRTSAFHSDIH
jgi:hypothetical protein